MDLEEPKLAAVTAAEATQPLLERPNAAEYRYFLDMLIDFFFNHRRYLHMQDLGRVVRQRTILFTNLATFDATKDQLAYLATEADTDGNGSFPYLMLEEAARRIEPFDLAFEAWRAACAERRMMRERQTMLRYHGGRVDVVVYHA